MRTLTDCGTRWWSLPARTFERISLGAIAFALVLRAIDAFGRLTSVLAFSAYCLLSLLLLFVFVAVLKAKPAWHIPGVALLIVLFIAVDRVALPALS